MTPPPKRVKRSVWNDIIKHTQFESCLANLCFLHDSDLSPSP